MKEKDPILEKIRQNNAEWDKALVDLGRSNKNLSKASTNLRKARKFIINRK